MYHVLGAHPLVEVLSGDVAETQRLFLERRAVAVRGVGDLSGLVVADVRIQRRHEHQGLIEQLLDAGVIRLDTRDAVNVEGDGCIPEQLGALEEVGRHDGLEDVELEVALHACHRERWQG